MDQGKMTELIEKNRIMLNSMTKKYHKMKTCEGSVKVLVKGYMKLKGWFIFPVLQGLGCYPGISDYIAIKAGRTVYIETKSPAGEQRPGQKDFQADIEAHGGEYFLVDCYEDLVKITEGE